jgi:hypothetical protein
VAAIPQNSQGFPAEAYLQAMPEAARQIPTKEQLEKELAELCRKGYLQGRAQFLEDLPGLIGLTIAGGPEPPESPLEWRERREQLRAVLKEIVTSEVAERLGGNYEDAALSVFRLDVSQPLHPSDHRSLGEIQADLNEDFGGTPTARTFLHHHRPLIFGVVADSLIAREKKALGQLDEQPAQEPAAVSAPAESKVGRPKRLKPLGVIAGGVAAVFLIVWMVVALTPSSGESVPIKQSIAEDVSKPGTVRLLRGVNLRDAATPSYFVVVRHPAPKPMPETQPWDEIRIYDESDSDAELGLTARPGALVGGAPTVWHHGVRLGDQTGRMYQFRLLGIHDTNEDGREEIYGTLSDRISLLARPFVVEWNEGEDQYALAPLIQTPPAAPVYDSGGRNGLSPAHWDHRESRIGLKVYSQPGDRQSLLYGATQATIRQVRNFGWLLITGYAATTESVSTSLEASGGRRRGSGLELNRRFAYGKSPQIDLLTVEVARLENSEDGVTEAVPCSVFGTTRIGPALVAAKLMTSAFRSDPLDPRRLDLAERVLCPSR